MEKEVVMHGLLLAILIVFLPSTFTLAQEVEVVECNSIPANVEEPVRSAARAAVTVVAYDGENLSAGSGFIINRDGYFVTVGHIMQRFLRSENVDYFAITSDCRIYSAQRIWTSSARFGFVPDLAVMKITDKVERISPVKISRTRTVRKGDSVIVVSSPNKLNNIVSVGTVMETSVATKLSSGIPLLYSSVPVQPGSSGGMMLSKDGTVVGMVIACDGIRVDEGDRFCAKNSYAVPAYIIADWLDFLKLRY